jgi:HEAT repeat protein
MSLRVIHRGATGPACLLALAISAPAAAGTKPTTSTTTARVRELIEQLRHPDPGVRFDAVGELSTLGRRARPAVSALAERLADNDANVRVWSARVLGALGRPAQAAVPALIAQLEGPDETLREAVALALGSIKEPRAIPSLARHLDDDSQRVRVAAAQAIALLGTPPADASAVLAAQLGENTWAPVLLGRLGRAALPALKSRLAENPTAKVRQEIDELLARIEGRPPVASPQSPPSPPPMETVAELVAIMSDERRRPYAIARLGQAGRGSGAAEAVAALLTRFLDRQDRPRVVSALTDIGEDAVPHLVEALRREHLRYELTWVFVKIGERAVPSLAHALEDEAVRLPAALALGTLAGYHADRSAERPYEAAAVPPLRTSSALLVPGLISALRESRIATASQDTLVAIGAAAVPALMSALEDEKVGRLAAGTLGAIGTDASAAIPALAGHLGHPDKDRRMTAAYALARIGPAAIPVLRGAFDDPRTRAVAAVALASCPSPPPEIVPVLVEATKDPNVGWTAVQGLLNLDAVASSFVSEAVAKGDEHAVRLLAQMASWQRSMVGSNASWGTPAQEAAERIRMTGLAETAVPALTRALKDPRVRSAAAWSLAEFGDASLPSLGRALEDPDPAFRATVLRSLGSIPGAQPHFEQALGDPDPQVREAAAAGLGRRRAPGVRPLLAALEHTEPRTCRSLVSALSDALEGAVAPEAAVSQVMAKLEVKECRPAAVKALARFGWVAVPSLLRVMDGRDSVLSWSAVQALVLMGNRAKSAVPALTQALRNERARAKAAEALVAIAPDACSAADALAEALDDPAARWKAALALGRMGPCAMPPLIAALSRADSREAAVVALGRLGPPAEAAVPAVEALLSSDDEKLRAAAQAALAKIRLTPQE